MMTTDVHPGHALLRAIFTGPDGHHIRCAVVGEILDKSRSYSINSPAFTAVVQQVCKNWGRPVNADEAAKIAEFVNSI